MQAWFWFTRNRQKRGVRALGSYVKQDEIRIGRVVIEAGNGKESPGNPVVESRGCNIFALTSGFRWNKAGFTA